MSMHRQLWRRPALWAAAAASLLLLGLLLGTPAARALLLQALQAGLAHLGRGTTLPNWSVYLLSACALACAWQVGKASGATPRRLHTPQRAHYLTDRFLDVQWSWIYDANERPKNLWAACPECATRLVSFVTKPPEERRTKMFCEHCRVTLVSEPGDREYLLSRVARQVERKLRTGLWLDSQPTDTGRISAWR